MNKRILLDYIERNNINVDSSTNGIMISKNNSEVLIKGSKADLIELADYIIGVALSDNEKDHIHLDNLTLISNDSIVNELIIEKE
ncbi:MAG: hypothetical protein IKH54_06415 [Bacilli bacterium]|nr:hypothetical protein [Bacilli bacterium]